MSYYDILLWTGLVSVVTAIVVVAICSWLERERHTIRVDLGDGRLCGLCFKPGAKTPPTPIRWPGQRDPGTDFVHYHCQVAEAARACEELSEAERDAFLRQEFRIR